MRKRLCVGLIVLLMVLGMAATHPAPVFAHTGTWQVSSTAGNGLNLRTGPGGNYHRLYTMPAGRLVKARGHRSGWMYLTDLVTGVTGWSSLTYLVAYSAPASGGGGGSSGGSICLTNYWGEYLCSGDNIGNAIRYWAAQYGVGAYWLAATASCESHFQPYVTNEQGSGASGLFQFMPGTFYAWGGGDLWDVWDQSRIAAKMFAAGHAYEFYCAILIGYA